LSFGQHLDAAIEPAFVLDPRDGRFVTANEAGCAMLGYTLDELVGTPSSRIHPGELPQLQDLIGRVLEEGWGTTIVLTCRTRCGSRLPADMTLQTFQSDGRDYILALVRDRSEHRCLAR
jgi:PAS domain S-box-containing protein